MKLAIHMQTRFGLMPALLASAVLAGCASTYDAPVRDRNGAPPVTGSVPAVPAGMHVVRQGETLLGIARQHNVTLPDLVRWNNLTDPNQIQVGQTLRVGPSDVAQDGGATVIPIGEGAVAQPIPMPGSVEPAAPPLKQGPLGGSIPYSQAPGSGTATPPTVPVPEQPAPAPEMPPTAATGEWQWPSAGRVVAAYNEATNKGLDIGGNVGDPVYAAAAGKVVYAGSGLRGYGKLVVIKHNQEYNSVYAHNDKLLVKEDDQVTQGQKIAELGSSETDRPKLHFEIRKQGKAIDPTKYLPAR
ncbi:peptidoglycan DD-metalloendopeptidase family protein [Thauera sp.]|uniref:peptidoglycan DD-metalloendopeptidase family protein n=1 Tax=Thauera sp. TaxID=1905334 RepID=UPI0039E57378